MCRTRSEQIRPSQDMSIMRLMRGRGRISPVDILILLGAAVNLAVIGAIAALWIFRAR